MTPQELTDIRTALERVFSGDMSIEAGCVADALTDLGWCGLRPDPEPTAFVSTRGLPKMHSGS